MTQTLTQSNQSTDAKKTKGRWTLEQMPDQTGRLAVVTGANSGLGYETTLALAAKGAQVVMTSRSTEKGAAARAQILATTPDAKLDVMQLDLADLSSIRAFAQAFAAKYNRLDLLINNAGVMALPYQKTADGFEMQFGTNHLGHFALTGLMLDLLLQTNDSRIVNVSSMAHRWGEINFGDLQREKKYKKWEAYGQSKVANLHFTYELERRLAAAGQSIVSAAAHPGYSATNLQHAGPRMTGSRIEIFANTIANHWIAQSARRGALPTLYAATALEVSSGDYIGPDGFREFNGYPKKVASNKHSHDQAVAARLWEVSEELTGVKYNFV